METIFMNPENSKTSERRKFVLSLPQRSDLKSSDKYVAQRNILLFKTYLFIKI